MPIIVPNVITIITIITVAIVIIKMLIIRIWIITDFRIGLAIKAILTMNLIEYHLGRDIEEMGGLTNIDKFICYYCSDYLNFYLEMISFCCVLNASSTDFIVDFSLSLSSHLLHSQYDSNYFKILGLHFFHQQSYSHYSGCFDHDFNFH